MQAYSVILAPLPIQVFRVGFVLCGYYLVSFGLSTRDVGSVSGLLLIGALGACSISGLLYSFLRAPRARWVMAIMGVFLSGFAYVEMCLYEWSSPTGWWDWLLSEMFGVGIWGIWVGVPLLLAVLLFRDPTTKSYFKQPELKKPDAADPR